MLILDINEREMVSFYTYIYIYMVYNVQALAQLKVHKNKKKLRGFWVVNFLTGFWCIAFRIYKLKYKGGGFKDRFEW